jgi:DNA repair exonuclease SbcCD nuclease subunit
MIKILLFSDSHLGFDQPIRPRIERRRRGTDFFSNYQRVLNAALKQKVDLIVHGGDLFFRSKVHPGIVDRAFAPLLEVANQGVPVYLVPGNHERSKLPDHLWLTHDNIRVFDRPRTFLQRVDDKTITLAGFPFTRKVRDKFPSLLKETCYQEYDADLRYLCLHQTFEGAVVGPTDFTFRSSPDNIPGSEIPADFNAVLSGHIHRGQQLTQTLNGLPLPAPVIYPGSIERTSFAERFEEKYYVLLKIYPRPDKPLQVIEYHKLPTRPMVKLKIPVEDRNTSQVKLLIRDRLNLIDPQAVVRIDLTGKNGELTSSGLTAAGLRSLAPGSMNVFLANEVLVNNTS